MVNSFLKLQTFNVLPVLTENHVHIWQTEFHDDNDKQLEFLLTLLDSDEQIRAKRFHFEKDRKHFIASHGMLRLILSKYLKISPNQMEYVYTEFGKPALKNYPHLQFNLSHSHNAAVIGVTLNHSLGVDIEHIERKIDIDAIAERFFSKREYVILQSLDGNEKIQAFFNGWTRKEAFLKAHGQGLSYSLENVEVSLLRHEPVKFLAIHDEAEDINQWSLHAIDTYYNYVAAVAVKNCLAKIVLIKP